VAKDWIDPSEAAKMLHQMSVGYFREHFVNPDTRTCTDLVVQRFHGPKGTPRYKILTISVIRYLQAHTIIVVGNNQES
jgi:hypothetical protein